MRCKNCCLIHQLLPASPPHMPVMHAKTQEGLRYRYNIMGISHRGCLSGLPRTCLPWRTSATASAKTRVAAAARGSAVGPCAAVPIPIELAVELAVKRFYICPPQTVICVL